MKNVIRFQQEVLKIYDRILDNIASIDVVAERLVKTFEDDALIHIVGAGGHSQIPSMEMFYRAGGIANVSIMFPPGLGLFDGKPCLERTPGMGGFTMAYHSVEAKDVVIICNYYGMNAATIDLALAAKKRGATVVGITSTAFSKNTPENFKARHHSGKNLAEICDMVIDTFTDKNEQMLKISGISQKVGVASTLSSCFIIQLLNIRTAEKAKAKNVKIPLWMCSNLPQGDEVNNQYLNKYIPRMRHLYPEGEDFKITYTE